MVLPALSVQIMIYCCKNCVMTDQYIITDENAALVLKMTAIIDKHISSEMYVSSEV